MPNKNIKKIAFIFIVVVYFILTILVLVLKRTEISYFEGRKTKEFPKVTIEDIASGKWMSDFGEWFNDTVPFRDNILSLYTNVKKYRGVETEVRFVQNKNLKTFNEESRLKEDDENTKKDNVENIETISTISNTKKEEIVEDFNPDIADADLNMTSGGAIFYGKGDNVRAMYSVSKFKESDKSYAEIINKYAETFPDAQVYSMMVPMQVAYYCPSQYKKYADNAKSIIDGETKYFSDKVKVVDVYNALMKHRKEEIYLRTDHHWSPLGAHYASEEFAKVAGVDFKDLSHYTKKEIPGFVGTLYKFTQEQVLKDHPETFVIYKPQGVEYNAYQMFYKQDENGVPISHTGFNQQQSFFHEKLEKPDTPYLVYMGGDTNTTFVTINNNTGRNLMILKDSFGNVVPPNLFYGFDTITVIDYRYFTDNFQQLVKDTKITDILFVNCIDSCRDDKAAARYRKLLISGQ